MERFNIESEFLDLLAGHPSCRGVLAHPATHELSEVKQWLLAERRSKSSHLVSDDQSRPKNAVLGAISPDGVLQRAAMLLDNGLPPKSQLYLSWIEALRYQTPNPPENQS